MKLPIYFRFEPSNDVKDKATDKLFTSFVSMSSDNGKALTIYSFAMTIYSKMSLRAFGCRSIGYSSMWRNNINKYSSKINSNICYYSKIIFDK